MLTHGGRQGLGARAQVLAPIRSTLPKGELANIPPGVEGMVACNQLLNAVREETRSTKSNINSPNGVFKSLCDKLQPDGLHMSLAKELHGSLEDEFQQAARGQCVMGITLASATERVIGAHLPPHIQPTVFVAKVVKALGEVMPDKYTVANSDMESQVSGRGLKLPPHAHLRASSSGGWREQDSASGSNGVLSLIDKQRERADRQLRVYVANAEGIEAKLRSDLGSATQTQRAAEEALELANAALRTHQPEESEEEDAIAADAAKVAELGQAVATATARKTATTARVEELQGELDELLPETLTKTNELLGQVNRLTKNLDDYRKQQVGDTGGPVKLEEIMYSGEAGEEQAIFLPTLKLLTIFKCIVCVPTPQQIQQIMLSPKQGVQLFALEQVPAAEDIQQFGMRIKNYVLASQLVGNPMDGTSLLLLGLKDAEVCRRVTAALDAVTGPVTIDNVIRKALEVQQKQQSTQLLTGMRGILGGKSALLAGVTTGDDYGSSSSITGGTEELAAIVAQLKQLVGGANAAGFKQAGRFSSSSNGNSSSSPAGAGKATAVTGTGGSSAGKTYGPANDDSRQDRRKCAECGRWHAGPCFPMHEACGRRHNPNLECYGPDPGDKLRKRPFRDRRQGAAVLSDAELAASALEGVNVWEHGGNCHVAALHFTQDPEPLECCLDDRLAAAAVAGGLKQTTPASFHQHSHVVTRRMASRLLPAGQAEGATGAESEPSPVVQAVTDKGEDLAAVDDLPAGDVPFAELRRITPSAAYTIIAIDPTADADMLDVLLQSGADTALTVVRMPSLSFRQLLLRGKLSMLPAATVVTSPAALAAALSDNKATAQGSLLPRVSNSSSSSSSSYRPKTGGYSGGASSSKLLPSLPYLDNSAFKLFDEVKQRALPKLRLLLDSGADGAILVRQIAVQSGLQWSASRNSGVATADGSTARPEGMLQDVKLLLLPGTPDATAVAFNALVMNTGGRGVYDAILGREQMHLLGMVMDFGLQKCFIRPRLNKGVMDLVEVPWICLKPARESTGATVAAQVCSSGWEGQQEAHLMASGDVQPNPGPSSSQLTAAAVFAELVGTGHLEEIEGTTPPSAVRWNPTSHRYQMDYRVYRPPEWASPWEMYWYMAEAQYGSWRGSWVGEQEARLMRSGDVERNPGPRRYSFSAYPCQLEVLVALLCAIAACTAGVTAVGYAMLGWIGNAAAAAAAGWMAAVVSCPRLIYWANLKLELARAPRAKRKRKRLSWQLLRALYCLPPRCSRQKSFKTGAVWAWVVLLMLLFCGTATATAGAMEQGVQGVLGVGTAGVSGPQFTRPENPRVQDLLAGEMARADAVGYDVSRSLPVELLEALQPAGERDKPEFAPETITDPDGKWQFACHPDATPEEQAELQEAVRCRKHAFAYSHAEMPGYEHEVGWKLRHDDPIKEACHSRRLSPAERQILDEKCAELETAGLIKELPSTNKYACHPVLAAKKDGVTGEWTEKRLCQDYRRLNKAMVADSYTPPLPDDIFTTAAGCKVWTVIDMRAGFHQLVLDEASANTTAFWWGRKLMGYCRLSFGTRNATAIYQRVMDEVLRNGGCADFAIAYVDDLVIFSKDMKSHTEHVSKVLDCIHKVGLRAHPEKSIFGASQVEYLGHMVSADGLSPTKAKVAAILALPSPRNLSELRCIMGIMNYYRIYIPGFSKTAAPIYQLTKAGAQWEWTTEREAAYEQLKQALATPGLALRPADINRQFILHTDWSVTGIGAVLGQVGDDGLEYMVACASRSCNEHERRYTPWKGELLAAVYGVKHFRHYLHGCKHPFKLVTDHRPLLGMMTTSEPNCQQVRWLMAVQEHDFVVEHREGYKHTNADALSRFPQATTHDTAGACMDRGPLPAPLLPDVIMPGGRHLTGEQAAQEMPDNWQEQMLQEAGKPGHAGVAAAIVINEAQLETCGPPVPGWFDDFAPPPYELAGYVASSPNTTDLPSYHQHQEQVLQAQASEWVLAAQQRLANSRNLTAGGGVDTGCCASTFFSVARRKGVTLFEPFGGLGAGLEMVLRHGVKVNRYLYADTSDVSQKVMRHRLALLTGRHPELLPAAAWEDAFTSLPMDVHEITRQDLTAVVQSGDQWLVVAGWECQDLSPAGGGKGLRGNKSSTYYPLLNVLNQLQGATREKGNPPVGYLLENTAFQYHWNQEVASRDFAVVTEVLGTPLEVDAARFGSRAHRLRNFWTNLGEPGQVAAAITCAERPPGLTVQQILEHGRSPMPVVYASRAPWYPCNKVGQPREALPTLMAYEGSYSFKPRRSGSIWDENTQEHTEPTAKERELCLGYTPEDTAAEGVTEQERRQVLGRCMDANTMQALFGICEAWRDVSQREEERSGIYSQRPASVVAALAAAAQQRPLQHAGTDGVAGALALGACRPGMACDVQSAMVAEAEQCLAEDKLLPGSGSKEPWEDDALLHLLRNGTMPEGAQQAERDRLAKRARRYTWKEGMLQVKGLDGQMRAVPRPENRLELINTVHKQCGHLGIRRTLDLLGHSYQWRGMYKDVRHVIKRCEPCDRAKVSFAGMNPTLTPLPIKGMFYRWHVDLCGPFAPSAEGYTYVMVAVEAYSKVLELAPLKSKSAVDTAAAFTDVVLCRYGACAEVCSDRGAEWDAEFSDILMDCMVLHRPTSAHHPQANGAAERSIQSVKRAIRKCADSEGSARDWPKHLPWIRLGYNCSRQESTKLAPYSLLYGLGPTIPPAVKELLEGPLDFDDAEAAAAELLHRQAVMRRNLVMAGENLGIAQERDTLRYAQVRDGQYLPRVRVFHEGDYVYLKPSTRVCEHMKGSGLTLDVEPRKLRVLKANTDGSVELIGRDGKRMTVNASNLTLCHLPDIDGTIDLTLAYVDDDHTCEGCGSPHHDADMLICDNCLAGWHTWCLAQPLAEVPPEDEPWLCDKCKAAGVTEDDIQSRQLASALNQEEEERRKAFKRAYNPTAVQKRRDTSNAAMEGRLVRKLLPGGEELWGRVYYRGNADGHKPYLVVYQDGSEEVCGNQAVAKRPGWLQDEGVPLPHGVLIPVPSRAVLGAAVAGWEQQQGGSRSTLPSILKQSGKRGTADKKVHWPDVNFRGDELATAVTPLVEVHWLEGLGPNGTSYFSFASKKAESKAPAKQQDELAAGVTPAEANELLRLLEALCLPRGLRYLVLFAGDGLLVHLLRALGHNPVTSDVGRRLYELQASPLDGNLHELVRYDIIIGCVSGEQCNVALKSLLRRATALGAALVLFVKSKMSDKEKNRCVWSILVHDPGHVLPARQ